MILKNEEPKENVARTYLPNVVYIEDGIARTYLPNVVYIEDGIARTYLPNVVYIEDGIARTYLPNGFIDNVTITRPRNRKCAILRCSSRKFRHSTKVHGKSRRLCAK